jgi:hypothetical protein
MKVTIEQMKEGLARYIDAEFTSRLQGFSKWVVPIASTAIINKKADSLLSENKEILMSLGYMTPDGMIDIDKISNDLIAVANSTGPVTEHFPILGDVTFSASDIESLKRHIR